MIIDIHYYKYFVCFWFFLVDSAHLSDNTSDENNRRLRKCYKVSYTFVLFEFLCVKIFHQKNDDVIQCNDNI